MKLLPRRTSPEKPKHHLINKTHIYTLLCFSLTIYLLLPSPQPQQPPSPASPPLKIHVYDLPPQFNLDKLSNPRCASHLFAAEVAIHEAILNSHVNSPDPREADFFFVPVYLSCNFSSSNGFPVLRQARALLSAAVRLISDTRPFWNRSNGEDHVFVVSHDFGACFHTMGDMAVANGIAEVVKNSILLQTFGVIGAHVCQEAEHVLIPPYVSPELGGVGSPESWKRDIFVFFRGKMELHPKNISGNFYSRKVRTEIWNRYKSNRRFYLRRHRFDGYHLEMARSVFCLCPLGWAPWSPRLVESVALGCVPVIIADGIRLPFPETVPWPDISLTVAERDVGGLEATLDAVVASNLSTIQRRLWDPAVRRALLFNRGGVVDGDATWHVLRALEGKVRRRSWRRRSQGVSIQSDKKKLCNLAF